MRSRFHEKFPSVPCAGALAECIPAAAAAFDAVICAQCFHWFADAESVAEIARVLVPGGRLGLIWNVRDDRVSWMTALTEIIDRHTGDAPRYSSGEWKQVLALAGGWKDLQEETRRHVVVCDRATVLDRVASISFIAALEEPQHRQVLDQVEALLDTHPDLAGRGLWDFPYRTDLYWCERR
jgi:SAM-dependent methyltransferase